MSTISPLGARTFPASLYASGSALTDSKTRPSTSGTPASAAASNPISLSSSAIDLQKRVDAVSSSTVDYAQNLLGSFAQQLFGDAAQGATIAFDSASVEASSSYAVGVQQRSGAGSITDAAALQLNDSAHFLGKGTITTNDGRKFDFEVEIQYSYELQASASQTSSGGASPATGAQRLPAADGASQRSNDDSSAALPSVVFPNIDFAGTLGDLFKLIGHNLHGSLSGAGANNDDGGALDHNTLRSLSLRLLSLTDHQSSDTYSDSKSKSVASAADAASLPATAGASAAASSTSSASDGSDGSRA